MEEECEMEVSTGYYYNLCMVTCILNPMQTFAGYYQLEIFVSLYETFVKFRNACRISKTIHNALLATFIVAGLTIACSLYVINLCPFCV